MSLLIGIDGTTLDDTARTQLGDKRVAGVILFTRNYQDRAQLRSLISEIRGVRRNLLVAIDQEGGRVQRLRNGFTALPALADIGALHQRNRKAGLHACALHAWLMAHEVLASEIDFSLAPVVDLARGNQAIGDRAFAVDPVACAELAAVYVDRMIRSGMAATLKHFPGHGSVAPDTHLELASDERSLAELAHTDLLPFAVGIEAGASAVMMAHVSYPRIDRKAAGFSKRWIKGVLRDTLRFRGLVMGDDVSMAGAAAAGSIAERVGAHYRAGCDLVLVCEQRAVNEALAARIPRVKSARLKALRARDARWAQKVVDSSEFALRSEQLRSLLS
jgi:beta-N-acetylhexosaminidase